jgi:hypothetical protein
MMGLGRRFFGLVDVAKVESSALEMKVWLREVVGIAEVVSVPLKPKVKASQS